MVGTKRSTLEKNLRKEISLKLGIKQKFVTVNEYGDTIGIGIGYYVGDYEFVLKSGERKDELFISPDGSDVVDVLSQVTKLVRA